MKLDKFYWEERYNKHETGWDVGKITTPLKEYFDQIENKNLKILIPGGGNSYEFEYLINNGFNNVFVIDIAKQPLLNIQERTNCNEHFLIENDYFEHSGKYDLIIEQTFFCALNPDLRKKYVKKSHELLNNKGKIVGLLFQFPLTKDGPPFGGSKEEYEDLFKDYYNFNVFDFAYNSIGPRKNRELFIIFEKKQNE